ncbi:uncharacterized protein LOC123679939 [Harmonia axyridis]|uniref:uncharacterized protein LOC123679939 n=1 Tax=Harmonia axyridis TaxID=115357 RepID=UPI001E277B91|nr:uncharacterized protein LOC123679939 [Harmonia axyridis]
MAEEEVDNSIPFLDIKVIRMGEVLRTDWYNKPSSSGRYLHYRSCHPQNMKLNLVTQMKTRVLRLTHPTFHSQCIFKLQRLFIMNGYPIKLLNKLLCNTSSSPPVEVTLPSNTDALRDRTDIVYATIPYIPVLSNKISMIFKDYKHIKIVKTMKHSLFKLVFSRLKDKEKEEYESGVVYSIPCSSCERTYIGQTSRWIKDRITSHKSDARRNLRTCALAIHANNNDHVIDYSNTKLLFKEPHYHKRLFLEMLSIAVTDNTINTKQDTNNLNNII